MRCPPPGRTSDTGRGAARCSRGGSRAGRCSRSCGPGWCRGCKAAPGPLRDRGSRSGPGAEGRVLLHRPHRPGVRVGHPGAEFEHDAASVAPSRRGKGCGGYQRYQRPRPPVALVLRATKPTSHTTSTMRGEHGRPGPQHRRQTRGHRQGDHRQGRPGQGRPGQGRPGQGRPGQGRPQAGRRTRQGRLQELGTTEQFVCGPARARGGQQHDQRGSALQPVPAPAGFRGAWRVHRSGLSPATPPPVPSPGPASATSTPAAPPYRARSRTR